MMNGRADREANVREWLTYAEADRRAAHALFEAGLYGPCAFHCQQAVEKLLKTAIVAKTGRRPPYLHDLRTLLRRVEGIDVSEDIARRISNLDVYYVATRYPGVTPAPDAFTAQQIEPVLRDMEELFQWFLMKGGLESI